MTEQKQPDTRSTRLPAKGGQKESLTRYLAFGLNQEAFAVEIRFVQEILQFKVLTEVPLLPPFMRGVINLRGAVVPVIDLSVRFGRPLTAIAPRTCIVILEFTQAAGSRVLGILVDNVSEVLELAPDEIEPAPSFRSDARSEFIQGVGNVRNRFVILLDAPHLLAADELAALGQEPGPEVPGR